MRFKKIVSLSLIACMVFSLNSFSVKAAESTFDATYYANEYPDVSNALGTDPSVLYQHYLLFGIKEGRYQNQWEEDNGIVNSSNIVVNTNNIQPIPGYTTYVDIDISDQLVTYFSDGSIVFQAPCVTGKANGKRDTPQGLFKIQTKIPGKRLKGPTWNVWVNRWMRFTGNVGLHDASWRSTFGGDIYKKNGSHGCVNLSSEDAYALYDMVNVGTTVIVHE